MKVLIKEWYEYYFEKEEKKFFEKYIEFYYLLFKK
jgi:hypothetical protein